MNKYENLGDIFNHSYSHKHCNYLSEWLLLSGKWAIFQLCHCSMFVCLFVQQHFSYIVAVSFIGEGNRRTRRKPPICRKSLTNFNTSWCTPSPDRVSNSQTSVVIGTDCIGSCKSNYHTIMTTTGRNVTIQWQASEQKD
jgi:hypothetical protein